MNNIVRRLATVLLGVLALSPVAIQAATRSTTQRATTRNIVSLVPTKPTVQNFTAKIHSIDYAHNTIVGVMHNLQTGVENYVYITYSDNTTFTVNGKTGYETQLVPLTMLEFSGNWTLNADGTLNVTNVTSFVAHVPSDLLQ